MIHSPVSICSMYYIDCFCSQSCPEQREYGFVPEKFNFCSIFGVNFDIKILCVNIILREISTANRRKNGITKFKNGITKFRDHRNKSHAPHIFRFSLFFTIEICIFGVLCKSTGHWTRALNEERMESSTELFKCACGRRPWGGDKRETGAVPRALVC